MKKFLVTLVKDVALLLFGLTIGNLVTVSAGIKIYWPVQIGVLAIYTATMIALRLFLKRK